MHLKDFDIIVSTSRSNENRACAEIWFLLSEIGDQGAIVEKTKISGLIVAKSILNPFEIIESLREILREKSEEFRYTLKVVPVEIVVTTKPEVISEAVSALASKIEKEETFRITVEKRHTDLSRDELIDVIAKNIRSKVDLDNPDKIILIQILGALTGISIIKPNDILHAAKEKLAASGA